ncbi:uncharacterized protein OCT59_011888 [Rhizophagus irregularis]|uniref:uncharacterized protein n=1 Tax=Rhizophagus irregularis TaxID=588596 RepID=UPI0019F6AD1F|nr:hypothetical protein OCT59_011888 [Rhizophagus irregularis]GET64527.1 hypothetical protein RIR_jg7135.t1 [Rhizophagus irregularis DAOM 181602=DAOM 197198]
METLTNVSFDLFLGFGNLRKSKKNGSISGNFEIWKTDPFGVLLWKNGFGQVIGIWIRSQKVITFVVEYY